MRTPRGKSIGRDIQAIRKSLSTVARDPLARMMAEESAELLRAALTRLSADHQEVLDRFYLRQEGTQFQIAAAMGLSVAAFNSRLNRARVELKRILRALRADSGLDPVRAGIEWMRQLL